jgi:predicted secreted protein
MNRIVGYRSTVTLLLGFLLSYAAAQAPQSSPPPLVPCEDAADGMPCVDIVTDVGDIVGMWRRYFAGATAMGFTEYRGDGTFTIASSQADMHNTGTISFEDGVAAIAASPGGTAPPACVAPGTYELRLIRIGEQPVALTYSLVGEDECMPRVGDLGMPMIYYGGSGEELEMDPDVPALAQPLVPCPEVVDEAYPCDVVVTRAEDAAGIWKQYVSRPDLQAPGGMGYQRINPDGSVVIADAPENTAAPHGNYPFGRYAFGGNEVRLTVDAADVPPMCQTATLRFHVYRYGAQPVALLLAPVEDDCPPRLQDTRLPFIWVADAN